MSEVEKKLFLIELLDDNNKPRTYRLVKAANEEAAVEIAYYEFTDRGYMCIRLDIRAYECWEWK